MSATPSPRGAGAPRRRPPAGVRQQDAAAAARDGPAASPRRRSSRARRRRASHSPGAARRRYTGGGRMNDLGGFDIERAPAGGGPDDVPARRHDEARRPGALPPGPLASSGPIRRRSPGARYAIASSPSRSTATAASPHSSRCCSRRARRRPRSRRRRARPRRRRLTTPDGAVRTSARRLRTGGVMATLAFAKLHGTANDFVYVDARRGLPRRSRGARPGALRPPPRHRRRRADPAARLRARRLPHADLQRRRQRRRDVRQRHPRRRQVRARSRAGARASRCGSRPTPASRSSSPSWTTGAWPASRSTWARRSGTAARIPVDADGEVDRAAARGRRPRVSRHLRLDGQPALRRVRRRRRVARRSRRSGRASSTTPSSRAA